MPNLLVYCSDLLDRVLTSYCWHFNWTSVCILIVPVLHDTDLSNIDKVTGPKEKTHIMKRDPPRNGSTLLSVTSSSLLRLPSELVFVLFVANCSMKGQHTFCNKI